MTKYAQGIFLLILTFLIQLSCNDEDIDYLESTTRAKEVTIPSSAPVNEQFSIDMVVYGSSGCSEFSKFETLTLGDTVVFELYQRSDKNLVCTTAIIEINASIELSFQESGTKYLVFNKGTEFEILDSIIIEN